MWHVRMTRKLLVWTVTSKPLRHPTCRNWVLYVVVLVRAREHQGTFMSGRALFRMTGIRGDLAMHGGRNLAMNGIRRDLTVTGCLDQRIILLAVWSVIDRS